MKKPIVRTIALLLLLVFAGCGGASTNEQTASAGRDAEVEAVPEPGTEAELYEAAQKAEHQNRPQEAIRLYRRILAEFPQSPDNYKAVFLTGFVFSEELSMPDSARIAFERVLREYPQSEFADDAEAMLKFLDGEMPAFEESPAP